AAADGNAVTYAAEPPAEGGNGSALYGEGNQFLATREANGWGSLSIMPPYNVDYPYPVFSSDLSVGIIEANPSESNEQSLVPGAPSNCWSLYARTANDGVYRPLFAGTPGNCGRPIVAGISADDQHTIFESEAAMTAGASAGQNSAYELER